METMNDFKLAFILTAAPITAVGVLSMAGAAYEGFFGLWFVGIAMWIAAVLAAIGFALALHLRTAAGILAGVIVGSVALGATCFANLNLVQ